MIKQPPKLAILWCLIGIGVLFTELKKSDIHELSLLLLVGAFALTLMANAVSVVKKRALLSPSIFTAVSCSAILLALEKGELTTQWSTNSTNNVFLGYILVGCLFIVVNQKRKYNK